MLVSSEFCEKNLQLLFTVMEKSVEPISSLLWVGVRLSIFFILPKYLRETKYKESISSEVNLIQGTYRSVFRTPSSRGLLVCTPDCTMTQSLLGPTHSQFTHLILNDMIKVRWLKFVIFLFDLESLIGERPDQWHGLLYRGQRRENLGPGKVILCRVIQERKHFVQHNAGYHFQVMFHSEGQFTMRENKGAFPLRTTGPIWGPRPEFWSNLHQTWHTKHIYGLTDDVKRIFIFVNINFTPYFAVFCLKMVQNCRRYTKMKILFTSSVSP